METIIIIVILAVIIICLLFIFILQQRKSGEEQLKNAAEQMRQVNQLMNDNFNQLNRMLTDNNTQSENKFSSFQKNINAQLDVVAKNAGEMTKVGDDIRSLNKTLSNVKNRGTIGECRLDALLADCLTSNQYSSQVQIKPNTRERVDFAINLPGKDEQNLLLPIDSKWPVEDYNKLLDATSKDEEQIARKDLFKRIEDDAKDITSKYINEPKTTDFAIMFLPTDSLYFEVIKDCEFFEKLRNNYKVIIAGPTTLFAIVDSISIGFKTLVIEQRSKEVWDVLKNTQNEFNKFSDELDKCLKQINTVEGTLESLKTTRTNQINKALSKLEDYEQVE